MKSAFTICSNNYLAKAKVVADSFKVFHPDYKFFIFLVDKLDPQLDYNLFTEVADIIEIHTIVSNITSLAEQYNIIELNTAVKPDIFIHLFDTYSYETVIYLDPDLMIFDRFQEVEDALNCPGHHVVITPHFCSPIDDGKYPSEIDFSFFGLYNLGFIAVKHTAESKRFLHWWRQRLMKYCYAKPGSGMFTDQLWVNFAPVFFEGIFILKHLGYNVANWNLYERIICSINNKWLVNEKESLKFFHFSQYEYHNPYSIAKFQNRHSIEERPDIKALIDIYQEKLIQNRFEEFHKCPCLYHQLHLDFVKSELYSKRALVNRLKNKWKGFADGIGKNA